MTTRLRTKPKQLKIIQYLTLNLAVLVLLLWMTTNQRNPIVENNEPKVPLESDAIQSDTVDDVYLI